MGKYSTVVRGQYCFLFIIIIQYNKPRTFCQSERDMLLFCLFTVTFNVLGGRFVFGLISGFIALSLSLKVSIAFEPVTL